MVATGQASPALLFGWRGVASRKVRGMMRRKTQGIPDTPGSGEPGRLSAHHTRVKLELVAGALLRRFPSGMGPRFASMRLDLRMASAGSRQEAVMPPGGAPMQPGCHGDEPRPAGAAPRSIN